MKKLRLLVLTQSVDRSDPILGFFHGWLKEFAKFSDIEVICLRKGQYELPPNVHVHSLGKERGAGRLACIVRFYVLAWSLRTQYDAVFVHMNAEYVVLGGILWRLMGKKVYLWRNHWASGLTIDLAVFLAHKTFCTSRTSHIAKYKKNVIMPVGIDTDIFKPVSGVECAPHSILSLGRVAPSKNIHVILHALKLLRDKGVEFTASIYGDALPKDTKYLAAQKKYVSENGLSGHVIFHSGIKNTDTPRVYSAHKIFVNASASGMFDKTIFESAACGATSIACSDDYREFAGDAYWFEAGDVRQLANRIESALKADAPDMKERLEREHSLNALVSKLQREISV